MIHCPAMNTFMWGHPLTADHLASLDKFGYIQLPPVVKLLACGDQGEREREGGRTPEIRVKKEGEDGASIPPIPPPHTHPHTRTHTHIHTHIHTYTQLSCCFVCLFVWYSFVRINIFPLIEKLHYFKSNYFVMFF